MAFCRYASLSLDNTRSICWTLIITWIIDISMKERGPSQCRNRIEHKWVACLEGSDIRWVEASCIDLFGAGLLKDRGALDRHRLVECWWNVLVFAAAVIGGLDTFRWRLIGAHDDSLWVKTENEKSNAVLVVVLFEMLFMRNECDGKDWIESKNHF